MRPARSTSRARWATVHSEELIVGQFRSWLLMLGRMGLTDAALALAGSQEGVVTRGQLAGCGVTRETIRWRLGRDWRLLLPGVVMLNTGLPTERQRLVAALLLGGEGSWLGGRSAAALHGLESCPMSVPLDVIVPALRRREPLSTPRRTLRDGRRGFPNRAAPGGHGTTTPPCPGSLFELLIRTVLTRPAR